MTDTPSTLAEPALSGMMPSVRSRGGLIALAVTEASWLAICGGLAYRAGLWFWLFMAVGLIVAVATVIGWIRPAFEAAAGVVLVAYSVVILVGLVSAGVQGYHLLAGHPGRHGAALGWALLTASLSLIAMFAVVGIFVELDERQDTVLRHTGAAERLAGTRWFGAGAMPPELLMPALAIPGVYACEFTGKTNFPYAVVSAKRVVLICLTPPEDPEDLATEAASWHDRLRAADADARLRCVLVLASEMESGPPAGQLLALGVTPTTADELLDTVGPWLGEPDHINVPIAAVSIPPER